jgi:2-aminoadipate transaminase
MKYNYADRMEVVKPSAIRELLKLGADPSVISFGGGYPNPDIFPIEELRKVYDKVLSEEGKQALQYTTTDGLPALREKLVERMKRIGVNCGLENLNIIQGGQQGLDLVAKMLINKGDVIICENPTFVGALTAFNPYQPKYVAVDMDNQGMIIEEVEKALIANPNAKFIYTIPDFHNPTGVTMSLERRKRLVELSQQYGVIILEDSPYREIRYEGESLPALKSFDDKGMVIYLGSFSKILSPGMRLGWIVAEKELADKLCMLKMAADTQNSTLNMYAANKFMEMYDIDKHIDSIKKVYKQKKDLMIETIKRTFPPEVTYTNPEGGLFIWLTFPKHIDATELMKRTLEEAKVAYVPGGTFFPNIQEANHCRMNYSGMSDDKIVQGISAFGKILKSK